MKGFHLYAVLLGSLMVAITVGLSIYMVHQEQSRIQITFEYVKRSTFIPFADIAREESFASIAESFRRSLELFLRRYPLNVPPEYLENRRGDEWIEEKLLKEDVTARTLASYLYAELRSYTTVPRPGVRVKVEGGPKALVPMLEKAVDIHLRDDSTILVFDPSKMDRETRENLPKLKVCEEGYCRTLTVFPEEKTEITIPLRLKLAVKKAEDAYLALKRKKEDLVLSAGFCKEGCAACGVFKGYDLKLIYPKNKEVCEGIRIGLESLTDETSFYRATGISGGGCANLAVLWEENGTYIPCSKPEELLKIYYRKYLRESSWPVEGNFYLLDSVIERMPTKLMVEEQVVDIAMLLASSLLPPEIFEKILGIKISGKEQVLTISPECKSVGYAYCAYPKKMVLVYTWTDKEPQFSVFGIPMTYKFLLDLGRPDRLIESLEKQKTKAEYLNSIKEDTRSYESCVNRIKNFCNPSNIIDVLEPACNGINGTSLEEINSWVQDQNDENCTNTAEIFLSMCRDPENACKSGVKIASEDTVRKCALERFKECVTSLKEASDKCLETLDKTSCYAISSFDTSLFLLIYRGIVAGTSGRNSSFPSNEEVINYVLMTSNPVDVCLATKLMERFKSGTLTEDCNKQLYSFLNEPFSPCVNPVGVCVLTGSIRPVDTLSKLCTTKSPAKLRSTFHFNIYDPTYMAVGCYAGSS